MADVNQDFVTYAGTNDRIFFNVLDVATGLPVPTGDIFGVSWGCTSYEEEMTPVILKDLTTGGITVPEDGVVLVTLLPSDTDGISGEFTHELRLTDVQRTYVASRGKMTIKYQVVNNPL